MNAIPNPNAVFPNEYGTTCFLKNVVTAPNIFIGDYTYYDDPADPTGFEANNVLFNWPEFGDKLIIGKFCCIASGTQFLMGPANHRLCSATTYPFAVFGGAWAACAPPHLSQLPFKGDIVVGNDVWLGRNSVVLPGSRIGDGNPARKIRRRFDEELTGLLLAARWWDADPEELLHWIPILCSPDLEALRAELRRRVSIQRPATE